jgi:DNA polymerase-1
VDGGWGRDPTRLAVWATLALRAQARQEELLRLRGRQPDVTGDPVRTAHAESAAASLCVELERDGLPIDRSELERLVGEAVGPRPANTDEATASRRQRDRTVLRHLPGGAASGTDLRNPAQVREALRGVGIDLPDTRSWRLEPWRDHHPVVAALLAWRKSDRIATTYGYEWIDRHIGTDARLRGGWQASDGAAGRMTAGAGLHNLPAELRSAVAAGPGQVLVRADLGQIEPRVLAAVSGDRALAAATADDDLYAPVASRLGVDRPVAKVAVLAAMYGQTSGTAGEALKGLDRAYPVAMRYLRRASDSGRAGRAVLTHGGRRVPMWTSDAWLDERQEAALAAARGRFARNAVVQGSAAELFKAWAVTVRAATRPLGASIVLCLHDELLILAPASAADEVAGLVHRTLDDVGAAWAPSRGVRFVADVRVVQRWSEAKE